MDQRHAEYVEYYRVRAQKYQNNPFFPHSAAAEQALYNAIATASSLEEFGERLRAGHLNVACAVARQRDIATAEANFFQARNEVVREAPWREILANLDANHYTDVLDLNTMVTSVLDKWNLKISEDEMLRGDFATDWKIMEDIETDEQTDVPDEWHAERQQSHAEELERGRTHFHDITLPEWRKFIPHYQPNWAILSQPRHRRHFLVSDDVFNYRIHQHMRYCGGGQ
jgi:hypothetical protein